MIDWLTLKLDAERFPPGLRERLQGLHHRLVAISKDGEIMWDAPMREVIRSDSHQVTVHLGHGLEISGSPARVLYSSNVFGKGCPVECAKDMLQFVSRVIGVTALPQVVQQWRVTRWDLTQNYDLGSAAEVRQALSYLRLAEGGHLQVRTASESVYWGAGSRLRSGKAYHKGPHVRYQVKRNQVVMDAGDVSLCDRLLRLELSHRSQWFRERAGKAWFEFSEAELEVMHREYFGQVIGKIEVVEMDRLRDEFMRLARTPGRGLAAYDTWCRVRIQGVREVQDSMTRSRWYEHKQVMFAAGLTWADLRSGNVVPLRRRTIELGRPVRTWDELRRAA